MEMKHNFPIITPEKQKLFEEIAMEDPFYLPDVPIRCVFDPAVPHICGLYGRACRQMNEMEGACRASCLSCDLAMFCAEHRENDDLPF